MAKNKKMIFRYNLKFFILYLFIVSCNYYPSSSQVKKGSLTLPKDWKGEAIYLQGDWQALAGIRPYEDFLDYPDEIFTIPIPSSGKKFAGDENRKTVTLLLHVELPYSSYDIETLSIMTRKVWTAHNVFINGNKILENGIVSEIDIEHFPRVKPKLGVFPYVRVMDVVIQISNFSFVEQGMIEAPILGKSDEVYSLLYGKKFYDLIVMLVLILFMLVNLGTYISNSKDKGSALYALLLLNTILLIPFSSSGDRLILDIFPGMSYYVVVRIEVIFVSLMVPIYLTFLRYLFPKEINHKFYWFYVSLRTASIIFTLPFLSLMFQTILTFVVIDILVTFYTYWVMSLAVYRKRPQAKVILIGFTFVTLSIVNDSMVELGFLNSYHLTLYGIVIMFFFHSTAMVLRLRTIYNENNSYSIELSKSKEGLELRVEERTRAYRDAMEQVKDTNKLKDRFLSIVSHDIRSPLSGVSGAMDLLLSDSEIEEIDRLEILKKSKRAIDGLILMTSEILNYAKNAAIRILPNYEIVNLSELISENTMKIAGLVLEKRLVVDTNFHSNILIKTDPNLLGIVLTNIFSNSIKFTQNGGRISIQVEENKDYTRIIFEDNGQGIDSQRLNSIFDYELNYSTQGTKGESGTGFGLPFSKEILDSLNYPIQIHSKLGKGTTIEIKIPLTQHTILIVDDNVNFREKMKVILNSFDLPLLIIEKEDVKSALKQIENLKMDFIFSDYAMPGMTGLDFAYELKEKYPEQKIPLVIVTSWSEREAHVYREIETKGKELGVLRILPKDLEQSKLQNAILEFIRKL